MKVKDLKNILETLDENKEVYLINNNYCSSYPINGYYEDTVNEKDIVFLTNLKVRPI